MINRVLIFFVLVFSVFSAFAQEPAFGYLQCVVKTDNGVMCSNEKVIVTAGKSKFNFMTDVKGAFTTMMPAGEVVIDVLGSTKTVNINNEATTTCEMVVVRPGVTISLLNLPDKQDWSINCIYLIDGREVMVNNITKIPGDKVYFPMPPEASLLAATVFVNRNYKQIIPNNSVHKVWKFNTKETVRNLSIDSLKPVQLSFKLVNDNNITLQDGTKVTGRMNWVSPRNSQMDDWLKMDLATANRTRSQNEGYDFATINTVVANGKINLPDCMPGAIYNLQLTADGGKRGGPMQIMIDEKGKVDADTYKFVPRKLTVSIFDNAGKLAVNTAVNAAYIIDGKLKFSSIKTNENGIAVWNDIPPVRVTVWGVNVPLGVIPADAVTITTPLELPAKISTNIMVKSTPDKIMGIFASKTGGEIRGDNKEYYVRTINTLNDYSRFNNYMDVYTNSKVLIYLMTDEQPPRVKTMSFYMPFNDSPDANYGNNSCTVDVTDYEPSPVTELKIMNADGVTPADFSNMSIISDEIPLEIMRGYGNILVKLNKTADGVTVRGVAGGNYRLLVDMISDPMNPAGSFTMPSKDPVVIKLKNESVLLPGGATVNWVNYDNPIDVHSMILPAEKPQVLVYSDKESVLGWWCKTAPNNLKLSVNGVVKDLSLRTFTFKQVDENDKEIVVSINYMQPTLASLLPQVSDTIRAGQHMLNVMNNSETSDSQINNKTRYNLWNTRYLLNARNTNKVTAGVDINKDTPAEIVIKKPGILNDTIIQNRKYVYVDNDINGNTYSSSDYMVIPDGDISRKKVIRRDYNSYLDLPDTTSKITIVYPTIGVLRDVPYLFENNQIKVKRSDFKPLTTLKGKLYDSKGAVIKNSVMTLVYAGLPDTGCGVTMRKNTDNDGNYSFENLPAGSYMISSGDDYYSYGRHGVNTSNKAGSWIVVVPEDKTEFVFDAKLSENPIMIRPNVNEYSSSGYVGMYAWLLQDGTDKAIQLPYSRSIISIHDFQPKNGTLYVFSMTGTRDRSAIYSRVSWNTKIDINNVPPISSDIKLPLISIISPLAENLNYPAKLSIYGTGPWEDIQYKINLQWMFYSGLNSAVAQVGNIPPGEWLFRITTDSGKIIDKKITVGTTDFSIKVDVR